MIEASRLSFGYRVGQPVLRDWSAWIKRGEVVSLVGPSGRGKSTLLYILGTLIRPWSGTLLIANLNVATLGDRARSDVRAAVVGFVFQDALLDPHRTVLDNVIEGAIYRGGNRRQACARGRSLLDRFEVDVEHNRRATDLSGGQAQRVALCRALLNNPLIVLADEPTGNLDRVNAAAVENALFEQAEAGAVVVIATHNEQLAGRCTRTFRL